jgi:phosphatidate cytidylyltransferase
MSQFFKRLISTLILIPLIFLVIIKGSFIFNSVTLISMFVAIHEWYKMKINKKYHYLGLSFILFSFYTIYFLRNEFDNDYSFFLIIIIICISTDIGGYVFGKLFKGPKITKISPNKTYSGMIGGYLLSIITILTFYNFIIVNLIFDLNTLIFVFLVSSISQIGDIVVSFFKRTSQIKDTGNLIPGHGGLLDRIDGMIFAFPFSYLIFKFNLLKIL